MLLDLAADPPPEGSPAELCIIGSGAAGLSIALQFINTPTRVVVLEAGGENYTVESQSIYRGNIVGYDMPPLDGMRLRFFGGTTFHWGGLCRPLEAADFEKKPWVDGSGWPIGRADLDPFIPRVHEILELGPAEYSLNKLAPPENRYLDLDPALFRHDVWRLSPPTRFGLKYRAAFEGSKNIDVMLNAAVVELVFAPGTDRIDHVRVQGPKRQVRTLRAGTFVLATGGIENARLLLASRSTLPTGIGNQKDLVGRYFQEHPHVNTGTLHLFDQNLAAVYASSYKEFLGASHSSRILPAIVMAGPRQVQDQTLNNAFSLFLDSNLDPSVGYLALRRLLGVGGGTQDFWRDVKTVAGDLEGAFEGAYHRLERVVRPVTQFRMFTRAEQAPNRNSRVFLGDDVDDNGMPRISVDWRVGLLDKRTIRTANMYFGREIGRLGLGRVQLPAWLLADDDDFGDGFYAAGHHMGTTRMAVSSDHGVVDADCRVFGTQNLYVAGSSVFPTGGYANPTFTIVQLALRLADHLKSRIRRA